MFRLESDFESEKLHLTLSLHSMSMFDMWTACAQQMKCQKSKQSFSVTTTSRYISIFKCNIQNTCAVFISIFGAQVDKGPVKQMKDMSIKEGEKIHIKTSAKRPNKPKAGGGGGLSALKPPPPAGSVVHVKSPQESTTENVISNDVNNSNNTINSESQKGNDDDEWGDFESFS